MYGYCLHVTMNSKTSSTLSAHRSKRPAMSLNSLLGGDRAFSCYMFNRIHRIPNVLFRLLTVSLLTLFAENA
jgi:hypothetical protein